MVSSRSGNTKGFENESSLTAEDIAELRTVARKVLKRTDGDLAASNHVGVITTRRGLVLEILPKIDLGGEADPDHERTRQAFLRMLQMLARTEARHCPRAAFARCRASPCSMSSFGSSC